MPYGILRIDSGFRCGADAAKALALGAHAIQLGRPTLYGLAAAGETGVRHAPRILADDLSMALALALALSGARNLEQLRGKIDRAKASLSSGRLNRDKLLARRKTAAYR